MKHLFYITLILLHSIICVAIIFLLTLYHFRLPDIKKVFKFNNYNSLAHYYYENIWNKHKETKQN